MNPSAIPTDATKKWLSRYLGCAPWVGYLSYVASGWMAVAICLCLLGAVFSIALTISDSIDERKRRAREREPCSHGIQGASAKPDICAQCIANRAEAEARAERQRADELQRAKEARAREYAEWVARIRLPEYLKAMHPQQFEQLICQLYGRLGYEAELTRYTGDSGIDAYLRKGGQTTILQCKRVKGSVGEPVLRDLYGTMRAENASIGLVVTTGKVSRQAREWAEGKPIEIIELDSLLELIRHNFTEADILPADFQPSAVADATTCPRCSSHLRLKKGRWGKFWGCAAFPQCKYTRRWTKRRLS